MACIRKWKNCAPRRGKLHTLDDWIIWIIVHVIKNQADGCPWLRGFAVVFFFLDAFQISYPFLFDRCSVGAR